MWINVPVFLSLLAAGVIVCYVVGALDKRYWNR
jgi:hypothetical protein